MQQVWEDEVTKQCIKMVSKMSASHENIGPHSCHHLFLSHNFFLHVLCKKVIYVGNVHFKF
jgi:hypothetical protein